MRALTIALLLLPILCFSQIEILENGNIGIGLLNPQHKIHINGPVHSTGDFTIGSGGNAFLNVKHIEGKSHVDNATGNLYLNWRSKKNVQIGRENVGSLIVSGTTYSRWFRAQANTGLYFQSHGGGLRMIDKTWIRTYGNKSFYQNQGVFRTDGTLQVGPNGNRFWVGLKETTPRVGIQTNAPTQTLTVNGTAGKPGGGVWSTFSDKKVKKNISKYEDGLEQVLKINPVKFQYNGKAGITNTDKQFIGVIAQEIQKIAPYTVEKITYQEEEEYEDDGELKSKVTFEEELLQFDGTAVTYMLVNAIKEQQALIADLQSQINSLKSSSDTGFTSESKQEIELAYGSKAFLGQNTPNPFEGKTQINYFIPENSVDANIVFYSELGQVIKKEKISSFGAGTFELNAQDVVSGMYTYSLEVDGRLVDSKRMIISK